MPDVSHARPTARRRPVVGAALALSLLAGLGGGATQAAAATTAESTAASVDALPFDLPAPSVLRSSDKEVFAHYVSWAPISLDDKPAELDYYTRNYLSPTGEGGKYASVGGKQRDRPMPRPVRAVAGWRLLDMEEEVRQAVAAGLDGFVISMVQMGSSGGQWAANTKLLLQAAENVDPGFKIMLRPNMISFENKTAAELAAYMAELAAYNSAHRLADGRLVVSPYKAENWSVDKWKQFLSIMQTTHRTPVAFWPLFHNERLWSQTFDPISYGMTHWGDRNPAWNDPVPTHKDSRLGRVAAAHALGQKWMQPVSLSDSRPREGLFDEAENTTNLRNTWQIAIESGSEAVHIPTWNDHAEGSQIQRTSKNGGAVLDLNSYYLTWYKTGVRPTIVRDSVYLTHRTQPAAALPTYPQTTLMRNRGGSPTRDTVEALTFLTAPALVTVSVGAKAYSCAADAGVDTCTVPLGAGKVSVKVVRSGATVAGTTSPHTVTSTPYVQDLDYVAVSSGRQPSDGGNGTVPTSTTLVPEKVSVTAAADSYANAGAPSTNYGSSTTLSSRGSTAATSYLAFDVPVAPPGTVLTGAALELRTTTDSGAGSVDAHRVQPAGGSWAEGSLTWNNRPATTAGAIGVLPAGSVPDRAYTVPLALEAVEKTVGTRSTLALSSTGTDELRVTSRNHSTYTRRPRLVLTYTPTTALAADTMPPTVPTSVAGTHTAAGVSLRWTASTDAGSGVAGYDVHATNVSGSTPGPTTLVASTTGASGTAVTVSAGPGTWSYTVVAKDAEGNASAPSAPAQVLVPDTVAPTVPDGVTTAVTGSSVTVSWTASQDDVAVTGYAVHRSTTATFLPSSTTLAGRTAGTSWSETSRPAGTWYYRIIAEDATRNSSAPSTAVAATVTSAPTTTAPTVKALAPVADTYANESAATKNYGTTSTLSSRGKLGSTSYLRFQIPTAPAGRTLTSAVLRFRTTNDEFAGSPEVQTVRTASNSWSETGLTWANRPATSSTGIGSVHALAAGTEYKVALSPAAVRALQGQSATLALTSTGTDSVWLWSSGHANAGYRPQLVLTWS